MDEFASCAQFSALFDLSLPRGQRLRSLNPGDSAFGSESSTTSASDTLLRHNPLYPRVVDDNTVISASRKVSTCRRIPLENRSAA